MACGDKTIRLWEPRSDSGAARITLLWKGIGGKVLALAFHPERDSLLEIVLGRTGAPRYPPHRTRRISDHHRDTVEASLHSRGKRRQGFRHIEPSPSEQILFAGSAFLPKAEHLAEAGVIAEFGMRIYRQVIRDEVHVVCQQTADPNAPGADYARILAAPEISVMNQQCIRARLDRSLHEGGTCSDPGREQADFGSTFHLQSVWAIIPEPLGL